MVRASNRYVCGLGLAVSALFVLGASVNEGWSGPVPGLPFLLLGAVILRSRFRSRFMIAAVTAFLLACFVLWRSLPTSRLVHPVIGEPLELTKPLAVYEAIQSWNGVGGLAFVAPSMLEDFKEDGEMPGGERRTFSPGTRFRIRRLHVRNPSFETYHAFELVDDQGVSFVVGDWARVEDPVEFCSLFRFRLCGMDFEARRDAVTRPVFQALSNLMYYPLFHIVANQKFDAWRRR